MLRERWSWAVWVTLVFLMFLGGFLSEDVTMMVIGLSLVFVIVSAFLMWYVKIEHKIKKISELVSAIIALGIIVYGYVLTGSLILGVIILFILTMFFIAFILSYLLPKIRSR
jgi:hypothetical protein